MKKEIILLRPHVAKFIAWQINSPQIHLSNYNPITAFIALLMATAEKSFIDNEDELPPQYCAKMEVIIDIPTLVTKKRFFLTNQMTVAIDTFCHRLFLEFAALQMDNKGEASDRKAARMAYLERLKLTDDEIDEETVRRLVDFRRGEKRLNPKMNNKSIVKHVLSKHKTKRESVLTLFEQQA